MEKYFSEASNGRIFSSPAIPSSKGDTLPVIVKMQEKRYYPSTVNI